MRCNLQHAHSVHTWCNRARVAASGCTGRVACELSRPTTHKRSDWHRGHYRDDCNPRSRLQRASLVTPKRKRLKTQERKTLRGYNAICPLTVMSHTSRACTDCGPATNDTQCSFKAFCACAARSSSSDRLWNRFDTGVQLWRTASRGITAGDPSKSAWYVALMERATRCEVITKKKQAVGYTGCSGRLSTVPAIILVA
jgi:hypothetical protein